jgi:hypothetical protein
MVNEGLKKTTTDTSKITQSKQNYLRLDINVNINIDYDNILTLGALPSIQTDRTQRLTKLKTQEIFKTRNFRIPRIEDMRSKDDTFRMMRKTNIFTFSWWKRRSE